MSKLINTTVTKVSIKGCIKCGNNKMTYKQVGPHIGLYCASCGAWLKWVNKKYVPKELIEYDEEPIVKEPSHEDADVDHDYMPFD